MNITLNIGMLVCNFVSNIAFTTYVLFNKRAGVFYRGIKPRGEAEWFNPIKHDPRVY